MTTQKQSTRERILEAAEEAFGDKGYHETLVDEIVDRTSLSKGGVYFHFPSKEDLFFAVLDRLADRLVSRARAAAERETSPLAAVDAALTTVVSTLGRRRRLARLILLHGYSMGSAFEKKRVEVFDRFAWVIESNLDDAVVSGEVAPVDTALVARLWLGAVNEVVVNWLYRGDSPPADALPTIRRLLIGGLPRPAATADSAVAGG